MFHRERSGPACVSFLVSAVIMARLPDDVLLEVFAMSGCQDPLVMPTSEYKRLRSINILDELIFLEREMARQTDWLRRDRIRSKKRSYMMMREGTYDRCETRQAIMRVQVSYREEVERLRCKLFKLR